MNLIDPLGLKGFGSTYGGAFTFPGRRFSFHLEMRFIVDDTKKWYDPSAYSGGVAATAGWVDADCGEAEGVEIDWGSDILLTDANNIGELLGSSITDIGMSAGIINGFDFELSSMTDAYGVITGKRELSVSNPFLRFPYSANIGAEYHVGGKGYTLPLLIFGRK